MIRPVAAGAAAVAVVAAVGRARRHAAAGLQGPVGARLQAWIPPAPLTSAGRVAAVVWAAPITLTGLLAGLASATPPRLVEGVVLFAPAGGITGWLVRRRGFAAAGLGHVVIAVTEPSPALLAHELTHVRQAEYLGPLMAPVYLVLLAVHGYRRHPMEVAARHAAERTLA